MTWHWAVYVLAGYLAGCLAWRVGEKRRRRLENQARLRRILGKRDTGEGTLE